jgi:rubrerythrin
MTAEKTTQATGGNRTGVAIAPDRTKAALEDVRSFEPNPPGDSGAGSVVRLAYAEQAPEIGSVPPMVAPEKGTSPVLLDKLGERLAFERSGARLYELLLLKLEVDGGFDEGPTRDELETIRKEELEHFAMLSQTIGSHGGDPTAITPSADIASVETMGIVQVLSDPRTTLTDGLHAMLVAELVDTDAWQELIDIAHDLGQEPLVQRFAKALAQERDHLVHLRAWVGAAMQARLSA